MQDAFERESQSEAGLGRLAIRSALSCVSPIAGKNLLRLSLSKEGRAEFPHCDFQVFIGFVTSVPNLGMDVFERFAKTTQGARPLILGIAWIEIVKHSDRAAKEAQLGITFTEIDFSRGLDNLTASVVRCTPMPLLAAGMPPESKNSCAI
jgi:hypothetical protein